MATTRKTHKSKRTVTQPGKGRGRQGKPTDTPPVPPVDSSLVPVTKLDAEILPLSLPASKDRDTKDIVLNTGIPTEEAPEKQFWYRTPDSKARKLFDKIAVKRVAGHDDKAIAKMLKTTEGTIRNTVYLAKKNGWAGDDGEPVDLEADLAHNIDRKIVRNISASLDGHMTNYQTHEMTMAAAKGRGVFKGESVPAQQQGGMHVVAIQVLMPAIGAMDQKVLEKNVGGVPAYTEAEVLDEPEPEKVVTAVTVVPVMKVEFQRVFDFLPDIPCAIVGSAVRDLATAGDIDVLVPASFPFKEYVAGRGWKYLGGFDDARGVHVRRCAHFDVPGVPKRVQLLQWKTVEDFAQCPHAVLLRTGVRLHDGIYFQKAKAS